MLFPEKGATTIRRRPGPGPMYRNHRVDIWHLLSEPTFNATLALVDDREMEELARLEEVQRLELERIRDAPAPMPISRSASPSSENGR